MLLPLLKVDFNPVSDFTDFVHNPYVSLPLGAGHQQGGHLPVDGRGAIAILVTLLIVRRGLKLRPDGRQTAVEVVYDLCRNQIAKAGLPDEGMRIWFPYVATLLRVHLDDEPDRVHPAAVRRAARRTCSA